MILTEKQVKIMDVIIRGNPDGSWVDLDQLIERLDYKPSKDSMHFSSRALIKHGLVEKKAREVRRGQPRCIFAPTAKAYYVRTLL